ncbi:MAG: TonB family protein [candidate division Zixibacteria bacterium]|nr:TonB family protein [candidate division Zixibacteria bacterium]
MNTSQQNTERRGLSRISAKAWLPLWLLLILALVPESRGFLDGAPREYYYQPKHKEFLSILSEYDDLLSDIIRQRGLLIWGEQTAPYFESFGETPFDGFYRRDSVFIQRRAYWRSSLFASDLDFIEISLYTVDGIYSLRETYAINRQNKRWTVIDSAGFPLFERVMEVSSDNADSKDGLGKFLLTLLSFAGYGSYDILGTVDTVYHGIDLAEEIDDDFYPFKIKRVADTTVATFTSSLRGGVEVSRWSISYFPGGILIDESEQLITYMDLPELADNAQVIEDTSAIAGLLSDVDIPETTPPDSASADSLAGDVVTGLPGGDVRLADLIRGSRPQLAGGSVSYEILSYKLAEVLVDTVIESGPEFVIFSEPQYPPTALATNTPGVVELMVKVDSSGRSRQAMVVKKSGASLGFEMTARRAAAMCTFRPGRVAGRPVDMWLTYRVTFSPNDIPQPGASAGHTIGDTMTPDTSSVDSLADTTSPAATDSLLTDTASSDSAVSDTVISDSVVPAISDTLSDSLLDMLPDTLLDTLADTLTDTLAGSPADTLLDTLSDTLSDTSATPADSASGDN